MRWYFHPCNIYVINSYFPTHMIYSYLCCCRWVRVHLAHILQCSPRALGQSCDCCISRATFLKAMVNLATTVAHDICESTKKCFVSRKLQSQICTSGTPYCTEAASYVIYTCGDRHEYVGNASISNITALVQILAWCQLRSKLLSKLMVTNQSYI